MGKYHVVKPCSFTIDGKVVRYNRGGFVVELDDAIAATVGDALRKAGEPESVPDTEPPAEVVEVVPETPEPVVDPVVEPEPEKARGRRPRPGESDG